MRVNNSKKVFIVHDENYAIRGIKTRYRIINIHDIIDVIPTYIFPCVIDIELILPYIHSKYHEMIKIFNRKDLFAKYMIQNNFDMYIPPTYFTEPINFPCIMKPTNDSGGKNTFIFKNKEEYENSTVKFTSNFIIQDYIFKKYIGAAHILCNHGKIMMSTIYYSELPQQYYIKKGSLTDYKTRKLSTFEIGIFTRILKNVSYHGLCCIDYAFNNMDGSDLKIYEINPRLGGSLYHNTADFTMFLQCIEKYDIIFKKN